MEFTDHLLTRVAYRLRLAKSAAGKSLDDTGADLNIGASTIQRNLASPGRITLRRFFDLCESWEAEPGEVMTQAIEDARAGRGA